MQQLGGFGLRSYKFEKWNYLFTDWKILSYYDLCFLFQNGDDWGHTASQLAKAPHWCRCGNVYGFPKGWWLTAQAARNSHTVEAKRETLKCQPKFRHCFVNVFTFNKKCDAQQIPNASPKLRKHVWDWSLRGSRMQCMPNSLWINQIKKRVWDWGLRDIMTNHRDQKITSIFIPLSLFMMLLCVLVLDTL